MDEQEFRALSAAHALHTLSPKEEQSFLAALTARPEWQDIVRLDRETAAAIAESVEAVRPPASARERIMDVISQLPQDGEARFTDLTEAGPTQIESQRLPSARTPRSQVRRRAGWFALAASLAALLALTFTPFVRDSLMPQDPIALALETVESTPDANFASIAFDEVGRATLHWSVQADQAILVAEGLPGLDSEHDFELWIVRGQQAISLGVVKPDEGNSAAVIADGFEVGDAIAVTIEERGGSPVGSPTTEPILIITSA